MSLRKRVRSIKYKGNNLGGKLLIGFMLSFIKELEAGCFSNEDHQGPKPSTVAMLHQLCGTVYSQFRISLLKTNCFNRVSQ